MNLGDITLILGVDAKHLKELCWAWPTWMKFKPELREMPCVVFYDVEQVRPAELAFLQAHPTTRLVPWELPNARNQREKMLTGFVQIPAREVHTPWYLKIDTDVIATGPGWWIEAAWFEPDAHGELPVFIASPWGYTKPRYAMDLLDDWADSVPLLAARPRLNLPYSSSSTKVKHPRIISWLFFGRTDWTRKMAALAGKDGRLPCPSQDSFMYYCAARLGCRHLKVRMEEHQWAHQRAAWIREKVRGMGLTPAGVEREHASQRGVVYYHMGTSCVARLLVSLVSLRQHYAGAITILSEGEESHALCERIGQALGVDVLRWESGVEPGKNRPFLAKTRMHLGTPYATTVALDSDTLVVGPINELFESAEQDSFCVAQLGSWRTNGKIIHGRLRNWEDILPGDLEAAVSFGPAINTGVIAFRRDASIFQEWYSVAERGREHFIPDEVSCQMIMHRHPHRVLDGRWNRSCRHDDPDLPETRIIHYHGKKHCRPGLPFHGDKWVALFDEVRAQNLAGVQDWLPAGDRMLKKHLAASPRGGCSTGGMATPPPENQPSEEQCLCVILGAGRTHYPGWLATERDVLDITCEEDFRRLLGGRPVLRFLAEHVWEHLPGEALAAANRLIFKYLKEGGSLRIAVPDGLHPDPRYIERVKIGGAGVAAHDHQRLFTHQTLASSLEAAGFVVEKLEYWDETGTFHRQAWDSKDGHVQRSSGHDRRNRPGRMPYTSLIVDAKKPLCGGGTSSPQLETAEKSHPQQEGPLMYGKRFMSRRQRKHRLWQSACGRVLARFFKCQSVVDFGCGIGSWLEGFQQAGVNMVRGYEFCHESASPYIEPSLLNCITPGDLSQPIRLDRRYDLALCIEVVEHLSAACADTIIQNLVGASDCVFFSAARPGQRGTGHINCQPKDYWLSLFAKHGFHRCRHATDALIALLHHAGAESWVVQNGMVVRKSEMARCAS